MPSVSSKIPFVDYHQFLLNRYGKYLRRVPIDLNLGCPNRDDDQDAGCLYCGDAAARVAYLNAAVDLETQVRQSIAFNRERYHPDGFMAYFQSFTSTNAPVEKLRNLYERVLSQADFQAVLISTRPDCLPTATLDYLQELRQRYDVWVEVGIQTVHDRTLRQLNRGHDFACARNAVQRLTERGINVAAHIILGLPGELPNDFRTTAATIAELPLSGIKIHNLHVLKDTPLAKLWRNGTINTYDEHQYAEILMDFVRRIPAHWPLMRLVADSPANQLLAPRWWLSKHEFHDYVVRQMLERNWHQGDLWRQHAETKVRQKLHRDPRRAINLLEAATQNLCKLPAYIINKSVRANGNSPLQTFMQLSRFANAEQIAVLDVGLCLGTSVFHPLHLLQNLPFQLQLTSLAPDPDAIASFQPDGNNGAWLKILTHLKDMGAVAGDWGKWRLYWGDPRRRINHMRGKARIILLEPTPVDKYVEFYSYDFLARLLKHLAADGVLISPVRTGAFRSALHRLGLTLGKCELAEGPQVGTVAAFDPALIQHPLDHRQLQILKSTISGAPYRDIRLADSRKNILHRHEKLITRLKNRGWPSRLPDVTKTDE